MSNRDFLAGILVGGMFAAGLAGAVGYRLGADEARVELAKATPACPTVERKLRLVADACTREVLEGRRGDRYFEARLLTKAEERR